jgi:ClpP class serine protease
MPNWGEVLNEINQSRAAFLAQAAAVSNQFTAEAGAAQDTIRRKYLLALHQKTGRNVIAYYSGFLSKPESLALDINDEDKNGFMATIHQLDRTNGLDLILHTPGGRVAPT